jgi:TctA family transporter
MLLSRGDIFAFVERPLSLLFILITLAVLGWSLWTAYLSPAARVGRQAG